MNHADDEESRLGWRGWYGGGGGLVALDWSATASLKMCWIAARCSRGRDTADWRVMWAKDMGVNSEGRQREQSLI